MSTTTSLLSIHIYIYAVYVMYIYIFICIYVGGYAHIKLYPIILYHILNVIWLHYICIITNMHVWNNDIHIKYLCTYTVQCMYYTLYTYTKYAYTILYNWIWCTSILFMICTYIYINTIWYIYIYKYNTCEHYVSIYRINCIECHTQLCPKRSHQSTYLNSSQVMASLCGCRLPCQDFQVLLTA